MLQNLRFKFVLTCMLSAFVVLVFIIGTINVYNYTSMSNHAQEMLQFIIEKNGELPLPRGNNNETINQDDFGVFHPESIFQLRYFFVAFDEDLNIQSATTNNVVTIDQAAAKEYAIMASDIDKISGNIGNYKFQKGKIHGDDAIVFIDQTREQEIFSNSLINSIMISIIALILIAFISFYLSRFAIKPIVATYEKQKIFITNVSHEIKTPLTIISANTDITEMTWGESKWTRNTKNQIEKLTDLVNDLILISKLDEEGDIALKSEMLLSKIVNEICQNYKSIKGDKFFDIHILENISFLGNEKDIERLIYILLDNAFKYSDSKGSISFQLYKKQESIMIEVYNTTAKTKKGIHNEFFDRFYRGDSSHCSDIQGFGLGLSIAKSIVHAHKGKITAKSIDGMSITIQVIL